ncbi:MAG: hypothetical protein AB4063_09445 [Crocosphaera sp.]
MNFFLTAVTTIAAIVGKKILEKNGEKIGTVVNEKAGAFLSKLKEKSSHLSMALEAVPETPLNYPETVGDVENALKNNSELEEIAAEFLKVVNEESIPNLQEVMLEISKALEAQTNQSVTYINNIGKLVNLAEGNGKIEIGSQTIQL